MRILITGVLLTMLVIFSYGCSRHLIGYDIKGLAEKVDKARLISIKTFQDSRPEEEHKGSSGKFLAFASKDSDFTQSVPVSITSLFKEELRQAGLKMVEEELAEGADYVVSGEILHFQTMVKFPGISIIPYLGTAATLWESDEYTTVVTIKARIMQHRQLGVACSPKILFEREFNISEALRLKTGVLNLERMFGRGMSYQFKRLDLALADVLGQIRDEVIKAIGSKS